MLKDIHDKERSLAALILENGEIYWGNSIGAKNDTIGELCFNTSQSGYQEILTDPSYAKQIITFTFPHIGIVGTNKLDVESSKVHACGCIINQSINSHSNWRSSNQLSFFLKKNNITCISGIDTRKLTRMLSTKGSLKAAIVNLNKKNYKINEFKKKILQWKGLKNLDLTKIVSTKNKYEWNEETWKLDNNNYSTKKRKRRYKIACLDFGIKRNILRNLNYNNFDCEVFNVTSTYEDIMSIEPDGIFLSNGPGDPFATSKFVLPTINKLIESKMPIFGICLGHQILSIALGAKTRKMFQGHRGANHPVKNLINGKVEITSQNHGFEVNRNSFSKDIIETHISLFDGTNEGIAHKSLPIFSVQYHPEASPGPHDSLYLFSKFKSLINHAKKN